ncbi:hypothetical protein ElyMa_004354000 [Elysia marginata]|uniref:Uncharacterized protein n=1 Tax=Elysia marginata TaxID=1093978 RepID=A0AAV4H2N9_9GAST|nr:hypothetical protein ElyMa_004354000 [Elysia marginata]
MTGKQADTIDLVVTWDNTSDCLPKTSYKHRRSSNHIQVLPFLSEEALITDNNTRGQNSEDEQTQEKCKWLEVWRRRKRRGVERKWEDQTKTS